MKLKCNRCKTIWDYNGAKIASKLYPTYVTCPICMNKVRLKQEVKK